MRVLPLFSSTAAAIALSTVALPAHAHPHLQAATPADGSLIASSPASVALTFSEGTRLTAAWLQRGTEAKQKLGLPTQQPATRVTVALPKLAAGSYLLSWRAVGDDGHIVPGQLGFTISGDGSAGPSDSH